MTVLEYGESDVWQSPTFVLATPISGPALICTPQWESLLIVLPTVFVMPTIKAPLCLQYLRASKVSAASTGKIEEKSLCAKS